MQMQKLLIFFQQKKFVFAMFQDRNFNIMLPKNIKFWTTVPSNFQVKKKSLIWKNDKKRNKT